MAGPERGTRQKVAILGGGVGSVVTAYQLTRTPELRARYDVTVYQMGWRLGGKGASGRNPAHAQRIEEHGLHLWLGFYDNASRVMRDCLRELDRSWGDAFIPCDDIALYADFGSGLHSWNFKLPSNAETPGDPATLPGFWEMARFALGTLREAWEGLSSEHPHVPTLAPVGHLLSHWFEDAVEGVLERLLDLDRDQPHHQLDAAIHLAEQAAHLATEHGFDRQFRSVVATLLRGFTNWMWNHVVKDHLDDANLCLFFTMVDTGAAILTGIVEDELIERGFDAANDTELRDWLRRHGAHEITLRHGPLLQGLYDMAFAYVGGDITRPNASAGTAVHALLRLLFAYRGAFYWRMKAGMGDTVFAPFYEVLRRRGVHFRFFHCVTGLKLSGDRRFVEEITVVPQVDLTVGEYDPLVLVKGLPCWPSEPCWDQIEDGERLRATGVNLEHDRIPPGRTPVPLRRGTDFDLVVLGIPVGALAPLCGELMAENPRFREMIEHSATTMTHGFQVWLNRPAEALGWRYGERSGATAHPGAVSSYAPMTHLLGPENWPAADGVAHLAYFCGVLPDEDGDTQEGATKRAKEQAVTFLESQVRNLWPQTAGPGGHGFDWDLLVDPTGGQGPARFDAQFYVANFQATERYVLTPAGSVRHRLRADESGYENLYLAGDWVRTGLDSGCVEAAAMSGIQAARAISRVPDVVVGEDHGWLCDGEAPPEVTPRHHFVEYGGQATWPTPVQCSSATLFGFALEADHDKLSALCRRAFTEPTGGEFDYRPLGSHVMLTFADVPHVTPTRPPFSGKGYTTERQASLWIPVVKVRQEGPGLVVESLRWFVPLMWVDSPFSLTTGREVFGYPKNWGWLDFELPPPGQTPPRLLLEAFGGDLGQNEAADRHPLIEVTRAPAPVSGDAGIPRWPNLGAAVNSLKDVLLDPDQNFVRPDLRLFAGLFNDFLHHQGPVQLFLKQFRSITGSPEPAVQQVVEAPVRITRLRARPVPVDHHVVVYPLKSHPLENDFGLRDQTTRLVVRADLDFVLEDGDVRWTTAEEA